MGAKRAVRRPREDDGRGRPSAAFRRVVTTRALVTGGNGFVAQWAMRAMLERGWEVFAAGIGERPRTAVLGEAEEARIHWRAADITDQAQVAAMVRDSAPDVIVHLAGISHVPEALQNPGRTFEVNTIGAVRLLTEVARRKSTAGADPVVLVVGSAEQYGRHADFEMPLKETAESKPLTLYAASKLAQEIAALQAFRSEGVRVVCTRSFNHSGPGHGDHFLIPSIVRRAAAMATNGGKLMVGNTATVRDFLHVSDVVSAYLSLLDHGIPGEVYNVSSGEGVTVREIAEDVLVRLGVRPDIGTDPEHARAVDVPVLVGSNVKLREATGWAPRKTRHDIIDDLIHAAAR